MEKAADEGSRQEKDQIYQQAHAGIKPEDRGVILIRGVLFAEQSRAESGVNEDCGEGLEYCQGSDKSEFLVGEDICQHDSDEGIKHLRRHSVDGIPFQGACCGKFQIGHDADSG